MGEVRINQRLNDANKLIFVKNYEAAEKIITEMVAHPTYRNDSIVHLRRIELASKVESIDKIRVEYQGALALEPDNIVMQIALVLVDQHSEKISPLEAVARYQEIMRDRGPHPAAYYGIAFAMEQQGNLDRALSNYEQCVKMDPSWFPGYFGLSQICYQTGDDKKGDYYFFLFEEVAPFNVYGNFDTHRRLSNEFLDKGSFKEAEAAIVALSEWWVDNKGACPPEIQVYEAFSLARVAERQGDAERVHYRRSHGSLLANQVLSERNPQEGVLYFIAKALEEFSEFDLAFRFYKKILSLEGAKPEIVQKIGGQFLAMGEHQLAKELFEEAYLHQPDNVEIRFCLLMANLRLGSVNVEEYLIGKERMKQLLINPTDKVELLSLLHSLLAKFQGDGEVHAAIGEVYLRLGNNDRALRHYRRMYELDGKSRATRLKFAAFAMQYGSPEEAFGILSGLEIENAGSREEREEMLWLKANYHNHKGDYQKSQQTLEQILDIDPWNVSYLVQAIINMTFTQNLPDELRTIDPVITKLAATDESELDWEEFDQRTAQLGREHSYHLVYVREKLRFLYGQGNQDYLRRLVAAGRRHDANRSTYDFLRLLNTNFDGASVYWALGITFKDVWQLETAGMWFEQVLIFPSADQSYRAQAYLELADCYTWRGLHLAKAVEYSRIAIDLGERDDGRGLRILAHALLRMGKVREAQIYLEQATRETDPEAVYLQGLIQYRNGDQISANKIWKPLLTVPSENLRFHNIKQEIIRYYFEKTPYQGTS